MKKNQASEETTRAVFINLLMVTLFALMMGGFIWYFNKNEPQIKVTMLETLAEQFGRAVVNAHWQWQAEGRPGRIMLIHYNPQGKEIDRRPVAMSHLGWPRVQPTSEGCGKLFKMVMNVPMEVDGFRLIPEFYDGVMINDNALESKCRFRLSSGSSFDYEIYTGNLKKNT